MALTTALADGSIPNPLNHSQITGWVSSDDTRGSIDILWSCCVTIVLCCWVSTFPNVPSLNDKWYHHLVDKFNLACIGFLGPDYLFGIAIGQLSSAWRSIKLFRELPHPPDSPKWTLVHGFFADMGGFVLGSPDYPHFPVNSEQLHYLIKNGHVEYPNLSKLDIEAYSKTDGLSKLITLWQVFWFSASELQRIREGLPMTTFELTALSYSLTMLLTSLCWYAKPTIARPTILYTKEGRSIECIRAMARDSTHPSLPSTYYRTPVDFISPHRRFRVDVHWSYYAQLTYFVRLPLFSREMKSKPWDRFPSDAWLPFERALHVPAFIVLVAFSVSLIAAWGFHFPTEGEKIAWRVCSVYHAVFSIGLGAYYVWVSLGKGEGEKTPEENGLSSFDGLHIIHNTGLSALNPRKPAFYDVEIVQVSSQHVHDKSQTVVERSISWLKSWRNISPDGDPDMEIGLRAALFPLIGTFLYIFCRVFFYVEDFISMRQQPIGVYTAMNKYVPFMS